MQGIAGSRSFFLFCFSEPLNHGLTSKDSRRRQGNRDGKKDDEYAVAYGVDGRILIVKVICTIVIHQGDDQVSDGSAQRTGNNDVEKGEDQSFVLNGSF